MNTTSSNTGARATVVLVSPKVAPPWDSAIASFSWALLRVLLRLAQKGIAELGLVTRAPHPDKYLSLYGRNRVLLDSLRADLELFAAELRSASAIRANMKSYESISVQYGNSRRLVFIVQPKIVDLVKTLTGGSKGRQVVVLKVARDELEEAMGNILSRLALVYRTFSRPGLDDFVPVGIDTSVFNNSSEGSGSIAKRIAGSIDELRSYNDYVFSYMGPVFGKRVSVRDVLAVLRLLGRRGVRTGLIGFLTIRHEADREYVLRLSQVLRRSGVWGRRVVLEPRPISVQEKAELCRRADLFLYPLINPVEISDPPVSVLEYAACGKPSVTLAYGLLGDLYPLPRCLYHSYSLENVASAAASCLDMGPGEPLILRRLVESYFSLARLEEKIERILATLLGD